MKSPRDLFIEVLSEASNHPIWVDSPFERIKTVSNTKVGSVGQNFIEKLCEQLKISCLFPVNATGERLNQSSWDIEINGVKFELKTATQDTSGNFQFNHVRYHRKYDSLLCLGVAPADLYFGLWTKAEVVTGAAGNLVSMEKAANASFKLTKRPSLLKPISEFNSEITKFTENFKLNNEH